jgi:hypothetical protein|tara:strand:- start:3450 stop:3599 length:150 start_codon:yes stop_codon:yes gene_type:complete
MHFFCILVFFIDVEQKKAKEFNSSAFFGMAPAAGLEPATQRLTVACSTN